VYSTSFCAGQDISIKDNIKQKIQMFDNFMRSLKKKGGANNQLLRKKHMN
jgi:hypothetical protein